MHQRRLKRYFYGVWQQRPLIRRLRLWPAGAFSFAKLKRSRVMDVLRLVATSTNRDGTISGPVVVLTPDGAVRCALHAEVSPSSRRRPRPARLRQAPGRA